MNVIATNGFNRPFRIEKRNVYPAVQVVETWEDDSVKSSGSTWEAVSFDVNGMNHGGDDFEPVTGPIEMK